MKKLIQLFCLFTAALAGAEEFTDLQGMLDARLAAGETELVIPMGMYRLKPDKAHLEFHDLKGITFDFQGSEIVGTQNTRGFHFENCEDVTVKNLSLDYDPKLYAQGRIAEINDGVYLVDVFEGYPVEEASTHKAEIFDDETHELIRDTRTFYRLKEVTPVGGRRLRVVPQRNEPNDANIHVGDIMVLDIKRERADGKRYTPHAFYMLDCARMNFENVTVYASPTFCFFDEQCTKTRYYRCHVTRRSDDPSVAYPRMRSSNFDAYHSVGSEIGPHIEECTAGYMGDDNVNIRGDYHMVIENDGNDLFVIARGPMNIQPGDPLEMADLTGAMLGRAKAVAVVRVPDYPLEKVEKVRTEDLPNMIIWHRCKDVYKVTVDSPLEVKKTSVLCAMNRLGSGYKVINCKLGHNRGRGVIAKASDGVIQGNTIEACMMEGIDLSTAIPNWLEAAAHENVTVIGNTVRDCKKCIRWPHQESATVIIKSCRKNLVFKDNTIEYGRPDGALWIENLDGGILKNNTFIRKEGGGEKPVVLKNCNNIKQD